MKKPFTASLLCLLSVTAACHAETPPDQGYGSHPVLPEPAKSLIPTVNVAPAKSWPAGEKPAAPQGFTVTAYASGLAHPRWMYVLPDGDVLVAETDAPPKPEDSKGIKGKIMKFEMRKAGSSTPSANRITLLRGIKQDGTAKSSTVFLQGLNSPFGMALAGNDFYVADTDALLRFPYKQGDASITAKGEKVADLPAGPINHHWTKNVIASADGSKLYVTVGSNSNAAENGISVETNRADILQINPKDGAMRVFASGLRNPNGLAWNPKSGALWTTVNERDELGGNLVPDYMTSVKEGAFYGWPYSYYGPHVDARVKPQDPEKVATAIAPDYALGNHTASLGLAFYTQQSFPAHYQGGAFVGQHGSWNRKPMSGYKVVFIPFRNGMPAADKPEDFLTGFLDKDGNALGRPVGVAVAQDGALLVADDVGNTVWRVAPH